jgi:UDP-N-acetylmuramoyl-tripeptide--D-alanyl-D-alanine ligase
MNNTRGVPLVVLGYGDWPASRTQMVLWLCAMPFRALRLATLAQYPDLLVLEFAAGPKGDIRRTAALARPTVAIVTAIGPAHLEHFGTIERIAYEKGALVRNVPASGLVILGSDNDQASALDRYVSARVLKVPGRGRVLSENIAREVCLFLGVPEAVAARATAEQPAIPGRLHIRDLGHITVIDDAYNANPLSMQLGLDTLAQRGVAAPRRVAILGDMKELGPESRRYHEEIGAYARGRADLIIGVGASASHYQPDHLYSTSADCAGALPDLIRPGDCVLVKGSYSIRLGTVVSALKQLARTA